MVALALLAGWPAWTTTVKRALTIEQDQKQAEADQARRVSEYGATQKAEWGNDLWELSTGAEIALQRGQRGQVEIGGDRLDAQQQGQQQHHDGRAHAVALGNRGRHGASLTGAPQRPCRRRCNR